MPLNGKTTRRGAMALAAAALLAGGPGSALADEGKYPDKPVNLVVSFAPGGATDLIGRIIATELSQRLGLVADGRFGAAHFYGAGANSLAAFRGGAGGGYHAR